MKIYIGYDPREDIAAQVCKHSLNGHDVEFLTQDLVKESYNRPWYMEHGQRIDVRDGKPFSTEFSFTRFLVPYLMDYKGWALFVDCDFLFVEDLRELEMFTESPINQDYAVMVVKHNHVPENTVKMDDCVQTTYPRKNWSSFILWNCGHEANRALSPEMVNTATGGFLHGFGWLEDHQIGEIHESWNWLAGVSPTTFSGTATPKAIHYTNGGPWFDGYGDCEFADEWVKAHEDYGGRSV